LDSQKKVQKFTCPQNDQALQDATAQREALGSFTGSNTTGGFDDKGIGRQEDATIDNPNDSPRPKDRSRQGTAQAQSKQSALHVCFWLTISQ